MYSAAPHSIPVAWTKNSTSRIGQMQVHPGMPIVVPREDVKFATSSETPTPSFRVRIVTGVPSAKLLTPSTSR